MTAFVVAVIVLVGVGAAVAGWTATVQVLRGLAPVAVLTGLGLTLVHLLLRAARWHWLLVVQGHHLPFPQQLRIYLAGLALSSTPGKVGETWRSVLLLAHGVRIPTSLGSLVADRGSDVIGLALLGAIGGWLGGGRSLALEAVAVLGLVGSLGVAAVFRRRGAGATPPSPLEPMRRQGAARPAWPWRLRAADLLAPVQAWARLWTLQRSLVLVVVAMAAYGLPASLLWVPASSFAVQLDWWHCALAFAVAVLLGAASLIPGGLGATDTALVVQLHALGLDLSQAVAVTVVTRASTLGFAWLLGVGALASWTVAHSSVHDGHNDAQAEPRNP